MEFTDYAMAVLAASTTAGVVALVKTNARIVRLETLMDLVARKVLNGEHPGKGNVWQRNSE